MSSNTLQRMRNADAALTFALQAKAERTNDALALEIMDAQDTVKAESLIARGEQLLASLAEARGLRADLQHQPQTEAHNMNLDQLNALQWVRCHHKEMRRYLRILRDAKDVGASADTIEGLRRWVRTLHGNASNSLLTLRRAAD